MTRIIGLTGGIGSGKSTVARLMRKLGACVIDTDKLAHEVYQPGTDAWNDIIGAFGRRVTGPNGEIDRTVLGQIVFKDPAALERLNRIMHPRVLEMTRQSIEKCRKQRVPVVVIEVPLLIEAGWEGLVDEVWVVTAPKTKIIERLKKQRGLTEYEIAARHDARLPEAGLVKSGDVIIVNDGSRQYLKKRIVELWAGLTQSKG